MSRKLSKPAIWLVALLTIAFLIYGASEGGLGTVGHFLKREAVYHFIFGFAAILLILLLIVKAKKT